MDENNYFILASNSPRRKALLDLLGIDFAVIPSSAEEDLGFRGPADEQVRESARAKAFDVAEKFRESWVLGADTVVVEGGEALGKPDGEEGAVEMLTRLSGKSHLVFTGLSLINRSDSFEMTEHDMTKVKFVNFSREEARAYVKTGEPLDKAGSYGAQGAGSALIESLSGSYTNVVGLPLGLLIRMLKGVRLIEPSSIPGSLYVLRKPAH